MRLARAERRWGASSRRGGWRRIWRGARPWRFGAGNSVRRGMVIELERTMGKGIVCREEALGHGGFVCYMHGMKSMKLNLPGCPATEGLQPSAQRLSPIQGFMYSGFDNGQYIPIACKIFLLSYYPNSSMEQHYIQTKNYN